MQKDEFIKIMETAQVQPSSAKVYLIAIMEMINDYGENPTIEQLNSFIVKKSNKRQPHVKYAIYHFLKAKGREEDYRLLTKAKIRTTIRHRQFLSKLTALNIIGHIENDRHKAIATLQIYTGTRASEVISIDKTRIKPEVINNILIRKIMIKGKGDKARVIYLNEKLWGCIAPFLEKCRRYPFLEKDNNALFLKGEPITYLSFWTRIETEYKQYWKSLKVAASHCGIDIGTHDLRRSFAELIRVETGDIYRVQRALGHTNINTTIRYFENKESEVADTMLKFQDAI